MMALTTMMTPETPFERRYTAILTDSQGKGRERHASLTSRVEIPNLPLSWFPDHPRIMLRPILHLPAQCTGPATMLLSLRVDSLAEMRQTLPTKDHPI
jgi:hypothetical protein